MTACLKEGLTFSVALAENAAVARAVEAVDEGAWTPVRYPGAVTDPDTGQLISDAEVAQTASLRSPRPTPR